MDELSMEIAKSQPEHGDVPLGNVSVGIGGGLDTTHLHQNGPISLPTTESLDGITIHNAEPSHFFDLDEFLRVLKGHASLEEEEEDSERFHGTQAGGDDWSIDGVLDLN